MTTTRTHDDIIAQITATIQAAETPADLQTALETIDGINDIIPDAHGYQDSLTLAVACYFLNWFDPEEEGEVDVDDGEAFGISGWCSTNGTTMTDWVVEGGAYSNYTISFRDLKKLNDTMIGPFAARWAENFETVSLRLGQRMVLMDDNERAEYLNGLPEELRLILADIYLEEALSAKDAAIASNDSQ